ncbi:MAG TPA: VanZ family protein [Anaerolineales bacterium]|nr:VanZ family protein [Anaerolineales bacterium]
MLLFIRRHQAGLRWLPALFFAILIFIFSATPGAEIGESYQDVQTTVGAIAPTAAPAAHSASAIALLRPDIDWLKVGHFVGYFCLGFSVLYALSTGSRWSPSLALVMCSAYAFTDEFHQIFTPGRDPSPRDILLDTLAALVGVAIGLGFAAGKGFFQQR